MKRYFDTAAMVAAWRKRETPQGQTRTHTLAEFYRALTMSGFPIYREGELVLASIPPKAAAEAARRTFARMAFHDITAPETLDALDGAAAENEQGANIFDYLHAETARLAGCTAIVTLNAKHFRRMSKLRIVSPSEVFGD